MEAYACARTPDITKTDDFFGSTMKLDMSKLSDIIR